MPGPGKLDSEEIGENFKMKFEYKSNLHRLENCSCCQHRDGKHQNPSSNP